MSPGKHTFTHVLLILNAPRPCITPRRIFDVRFPGIVRGMFGGTQGMQFDTRPRGHLGDGRQSRVIVGHLSFGRGHELNAVGQ